jgi:hypothetical protein
MNKRFQSGGRRWAPWVTVFLCLGLRAEARAQEPEPPPVAAPQPASAPEAPPVTPPVSVPEPPPITPPASTPEPPPITPPAVTPAPPSSGSAVAPIVAAKPPLAWAGTTFEWENQFSTTILGVGTNYIGTEDESFRMTFSLTPSYFVFWRPRHQLSVSGRVTVVDELTNSDTTASKHAPQFADIPLGLEYAATLFTSGHGPTLGGVRTMRDPTLLGEGDWRTWVLVSTYLVLPASPGSRAAGVDLGTSIGVGVRQQFKLLGGDSRWLGYLLVTASERWIHAFTSAAAPVDPRLQDRIDNLYPTAPALPNTLSHTAALTLPIYRDLQLDTTFQLRTGFPASVGSGGAGCVQLPTGCVPSSAVTTTAVRASTLFAVGFSYEIIPELGIALGYVNDAPQLGDNGQKRSLFYSPNAQFYTSVTFSFDRLYQRLAAPAPVSAAPTL